MGDNAYLMLELDSGLDWHSHVERGSRVDFRWDSDLPSDSDLEPCLSLKIGFAIWFGLNCS